MMNVLESLLILAATVSALWWAFARHRAPVALERLSLAGVALGVLVLAFEGVHWQLVPWQLLALACAAVALLRRLRAYGHYGSDRRKGERDLAEIDRDPVGEPEYVRVKALRVSS